MFERIVVPVDGSELGEMAVPWAKEIASIFNSEISFVSVSENDSADERRMREGYLNHQVELLASEYQSTREGISIPKAKSIVLDGEPATRIVEYTQEQQASLLTLVSHGRSGIMPWPMGSTASRILSKVNCLVLFIRARKTAVKSVSLLQHILLALDGSSKGEAIIPYITELATRTSVRVTLFQAISPDRDVVATGGVRTVQLPKIQLDRLYREANEYLKIIESRFPTGQSESVVHIGNPAHEIMQFAENNKISLIGITTRGKTETGEWQFGQVAHKLIHSSITPVLIVRSK